MKARSKFKLIDPESLQSSPGCSLILRGSVPHEFNCTTVDYSKMHAKTAEKESRAEIDRLNVEHRKQHGSDMGSKKCREIECKVASKYEQMSVEASKRDLIWNKSERLLDLLRTRGMAEELKDETVLREKEAYLKYARESHLELEPGSMVYQGMEDSNLWEGAKKSPDLIFQATHPHLIGLYGLPFFQLLKIGPSPHDSDQLPRPCLGQTLIGVNTQFWGAFLGGDRRLGHDVIYYIPERQFYFYDVPRSKYYPTSEEKLRQFVSLALQQCAQGQDVLSAATILEKFRTNAVLDEIISNAKAALAAAAGFFNGPNAKPRWAQYSKSEQVVDRVASDFIDNWIELDERSVLSVSDCLESFRKVAEASGTQKDLGSRMEKAIRQVYPAKGLRNDLLSTDGTGVKGWKGLKLKGQGSGMQGALVTKMEIFYGVRAVRTVRRTSTFHFGRAFRRTGQLSAFD